MTIDVPGEVPPPPAGSAPSFAPLDAKVAAASAAASAR
jgi:hypothetical protein